MRHTEKPQQIIEPVHPLLFDVRDILVPFNLPMMLLHEEAPVQHLPHRHLRRSKMRCTMSQQGNCSLWHDTFCCLLNCLAKDQLSWEAYFRNQYSWLVQMIVSLVRFARQRIRQRSAMLLIRAHESLIPCCDYLPIHNLPKGREVSRTAVLVIQVIGMLPYIKSQQRL